MDELLPLIPHGASIIGNNVTVINENEKWTYFHGMLPIYSHAVSDRRSFKIISSSLILNGRCRNIDIQRTFNVSKSSVIRNCNSYEAEGSDAFLKLNCGKKKEKEKFLLKRK